jgi:hypothetical protein
MKHAMTLIVFVLTPMFAAHKPEWKTGNVIDGSHRREVIPGQGGGGLLTRGNAASMKVDLNDFAIRGSDLIYTVEETKKKGGVSGGLLTQAISNRRGHTCKLILNDTVKYAEDGNVLLVVDADQKTCKLEIVGRERVIGSSDSPPEKPRYPPYPAELDPKNRP